MGLFKYGEVIRQVKINYDKISRENISTKAGYEKIKLYISNILTQAEIPAEYYSEYLSKNTIQQILEDAKDSIKQDADYTERKQIEALKTEERLLEKNLSFNLTGVGRNKTINYCQIYIDYYKFQIEACDIAIATLKGDTEKRHALFNHSSNTWAYHGGIASAIAGPAAGIVMAAQAKRRDDERNAFNAQLMSLNIQYQVAKEQEIWRHKNKLKDELNFWEKALKSAHYQLEEQRETEKLFKSLSPKVKSYTTSKTGTITLKVGFSSNRKIKIYNEKPAYIDGSIEVRFIRNGKICASTICYLPFGGTYSPHEAICICTTLPALKNPDEKYDIQFIPHNLWLVEYIDELKNPIYRSEYPPSKEMAEWYYAKIANEEKAQRDKARQEAHERRTAAEKLERKEERKKVIKKLLLAFASAFLGLIILVNGVLFLVYKPLRDSFKNDTFSTELVKDRYGTFQNKGYALNIIEKQLEKCHRNNDLKGALHILTVLAETDCKFTDMYYDKNGNNGKEYRNYIMAWRSFIEWIEIECKKNGIMIEDETNHLWGNNDDTYSVFGYKVEIGHAYDGTTTSARLFVPDIGWYRIDNSYKNLGNWFYHFGNNMVN